MSLELQPIYKLMNQNLDKELKRKARDSDQFNTLELNHA